VAVDQEIGDLDEGAVCGQFLDGDSPVTQDPLVTIDEGDGALARTGIGIAWVEGDDSGLFAQVRNVDRALAFAAFDDR